MEMDAADIEWTPVTGGRTEFVTFYVDTGDEETSRSLGSFCLGENESHPPVEVGVGPWKCPACGRRVN